MKRRYCHAILILSILFITILLMSCSSESEYDKIQKEVITEAQKKYYADYSFKDMAPQDRQSIIDRITKDTGFVVALDDAFFSKTGHFNYPLTVTRTVTFKKEDKRLVIYEMLLIFDNTLNRWLPLSVHTMFIKDNKTIREIESDIWDKNNDWSEVFRK